MKTTCERCGRPLSASPSPDGGARAELACACGHAPPGPRANAPAPAPARAAADAPPLPGPREGNLEVDPWSLPPPEDGYENLVLDDPPAVASPPPAPAAARELTPTALARPKVDEVSRRPAARDGGTRPASPRPGSRTPIVVAVAVAVLLAAIAAWALLGRSSGGARDSVRVTVTQEVPWGSTPPLAAVDPSYVERARPEPPRSTPEPSPARPASLAAPGRAPPRGRPPSPPPAGPATEAPPPEPAGAAPPPELVADPAREAAPAAGAAAAAAVPLPPPPILAPKQPAAAPSDASPVRARAPVLQTRTCVEDALRVPRAVESRLPPEIVLRVMVGEDGRPRDVQYPGNLDPLLRSAISSAVRTCRFTAGADASGRPAEASTTMRLRFE